MSSVVAAVRLRKYCKTFTGLQLKDLKRLDENVTYVCREYQLNIARALLNGRSYDVPFKVVDTRHSAAHAVGSWLRSHRAHFADIEIRREWALLCNIQIAANRTPVITDNTMGEDDAADHIEPWIEITRLFGVCLRETRRLREQGIAVDEPPLVVYPPLALLKVDPLVKPGV
jgi:hypothetical protein